MNNIHDYLSQRNISKHKIYAILFSAIEYSQNHFRHSDHVNISLLKDCGNRTISSESVPFYSYSFTIFFLCYLLTAIVNKENLNKPESLGLFSFKYIKHLLYEVLDAKCCVSVSIPPPAQPASHLHTIHYLLS